MNYRQVKAIEYKNKQRILRCCVGVPETSGIYILTRFEDGFKYAYVGQAKHLLTRLAQHLAGYQHIDISLKKHGLFSFDNQEGWHINYTELPEAELDKWEQHYIKEYANAGYQLRNKTKGGQGQGKSGLNENKPVKGYRDGLKQGRKNLAKELNYIIDKHLLITLKKENKISQNALNKFNALLDRQ